MQDRGEYGPFNGEFEAAILQHLMKDSGTAGLFPQSAKQQRCADPLAPQRFEFTRRKLRSIQLIADLNRVGKA